MLSSQNNAFGAEAARLARVSFPVLTTHQHNSAGARDLRYNDLGGMH